MQTQRCCGVGSDAGDPATLSLLPQTPAPTALATTLLAPPSIPSWGTVPTLEPVAMMTGPPPYRRTQKLQR